jgi:hypothetical protein
MDLPDGCRERAIIAAGYAVDQTGLEAHFGNSRRYLCQNCGLWWKHIDFAGGDALRVCKRCRDDRDYLSNNPKGYPRLY